MKPHLILLLCAAIALSSCGTQSATKSVTNHADGSATTVTTPVLDPKEAAFQERCKAVMEVKL